MAALVSISRGSLLLAQVHDEIRRAVPGLPAPAGLELGRPGYPIAVPEADDQLLALELVDRLGRGGRLVVHDLAGGLVGLVPRSRPTLLIRLGHVQLPRRL